jgi:hypothetical protein
LEALARQRNAELRRECLEALTGPGALPECYLIMDASSLDRRTLRRRRGWAPRGLPAKLYEHFEVKGSARCAPHPQGQNSRFISRNPGC